MNTKLLLLLAIPLILLFAVTCKSKESTSSTDPSAATVTHPDWAQDATIYEVNIRQYSTNGTFAEFQEHRVSGIKEKIEPG